MGAATGMKNYLQNSLVVDANQTKANIPGQLHQIAGRVAVLVIYVGMEDAFGTYVDSLNVYATKATLGDSAVNQVADVDYVGTEYVEEVEGMVIFVNVIQDILV